MNAHFPKGYCHRWATGHRGLSLNSPLSQLGAAFGENARHDLNARLRDECRGARKCLLLSQLLDLRDSVRREEEWEHAAILRLPRATRKG